MNTNSVRFNGDVGEVRLQYQVAASLSSWSISTDSLGAVILTAKVVSHDAYRVSQQPLTFQVPRPSGTPWVWPLQSLQIANGSLTATLASQE